MTDVHSPDLMPVLSQGKHRNARKGACFMELASYLAGERWSDHPNCTHPLLAVMARGVNDHVGDRLRGRLAPLIPDVIGLTSDDPRIDVWIAREAALTALPIVAAEHQGVAAVGLLRCERVLNALEGQPAGRLSPRTAAALDDAPLSRDWARSFCEMGWGSSHTFSRRSAPTIVYSAVTGIAAAPHNDPDSVLVDMLERTIVLCHEWMQRDTALVASEAWRELCGLTSRP